MTKHKVSGVPYEVELVNDYVTLLDQLLERGDTIAKLSRENFLLKNKVESLVKELEKYKDDGK